jgi:transglutaminase-like putative cysteine protease
MDAVFNLRVIVSLISLFLIFPSSSIAGAGPNSIKIFKSNSFKYQIALPSAWIDENSYSIPSKKSHEPLNYLLLDHQVKFTPESTEEYYRYVERPLTTDGLEQVSTIEVVFNPAYQTLTWHAVSIIREGKVIERLNSSDIKLLQREEGLSQAIVDGYVTAVLVVRGTRKGDILDYSFTKTGRNPIFGPHIFYSSQMAWGVQIDQLHKRFIFETNDELQYQSYQFSHKPEITENKNQIEYKWAIQNTPTIFTESDLPNWYLSFPQVNFTTFNSWKKVSEWAAPLYSTRVIRNAELLKFVSGIQSLTDEKKVLKALEYVQGEIRYLGIELGVNSHKPRGPDSVVEKRYGDCKDKTLLLISILALLDIPAYPALVSTYGGVPMLEYLPMPSEFNHVITRVELGDKIFWLDPTWNPQAGKLSQLGYKNFDYALVVGHPSLDLTAMPSAPESLTQIHTLEKFNILSYEGAVDYTISTSYSGIEADYMRSSISNQGLTGMERNYLNYMTRLYPSIDQIKPLVLSDDKENNLLTLTETYRLKDFFRKKEGVLSTDIFAFSLVDYLTIPNTAKRQSPLKYIYPVHVTHETHVKYPEYFNMSLSNNVPEIDTPYFNLRYTEDYRDQTIITKTEYESKAYFIPSSDVTSHIEALRRANKIISNSYDTTYSKEDIPAFKTLASFIGRLNKHVGDLEGESL